MTFAALLTKELRLRLRRERTIWVLITYLLVMTLLGFLFISRTNTYNSNSVSTLVPLHRSTEKRSGRPLTCCCVRGSPLLNWWQANWWQDWQTRSC